MNLGKFAASVVAAGTCVLALAQPVGGAQPTDTTHSVDDAQQTQRQARTIKQYQSGYRMAWVPDFNLCLGVYMRGYVQATSTFTVTAGGTILRKLHSPKLIDPYMLVTTKKTCDDSSSVKKRHKINIFTHKMFAYGYTCSYNPSFSVGIPWSVTVGATPECGNETVAAYGQRQTGATTKSRYELVTDGFGLGWDQSDTDSGPGYDMKLCTSMSGYFKLVDTVGPAVKTVVKKVRMPDFCVEQNDN